MARASTPTLLPLDTWAAVMGLDLWDFNQISNGFGVLPVDRPQCPHTWYQFSYQFNFLSREEVADSIAKAERMLADELRFWPAPKYITSEEVQYPRNYRRTIYGFGANARGDWKSMQVEWEKVQGPGILVRTFIGASGPVTPVDQDGDGITDHFTCTIATTVTDPTQIAVFFQSGDRFGNAIDSTWQVRPVTVTISGGTATVTGHIGLVVKPALQTAYVPTGLDIAVLTNFVANLDVYQETLDGTTIAPTSTTPGTANQGTAEWEGDITVPPGAVQTLPVALIARNADLGLVGVDWMLNGAQTPPQPREPDRVVVNYLAGQPLISGQMARFMADIVAHLATGLLPALPCGCERSNQIIMHWRELPTMGESKRPMTTNEVDNCPFGQTRGALWAWQQVRNLRHK